MKRRVILLVGVFVLGMAVSVPGFAQEMSNYELLQELKTMKAKIERLESQLEIQKTPPAVHGDRDKSGRVGVKGLTDRVKRIEEQMAAASVLGKWAEKISISGAVEVEAGYENVTFAAPGVADEDTSDIALATVELGIDVDIARHVGGHVVLLWEEDDTEPVDIDEAFIILDGKDVVPLYLNAGKMYVPFGNFESHFISDPLTLALGETRESAVKVGFANDWAEICVAAFNGDIDEKNDDDHIKGFVTGATFTLPEESLPNLGLSMGVSFISNIADSDGLEGEMVNGSVKDSVAGFSAFLSAAFNNKFFIEAEYVGALDEFEAGELSFDGGQELQPATWNVEFAVAVSETLEAAVRCEGGEDLADFLPEIQYGAAIAYNLFDNTTLAFEYLYGEFENDDERDLLTVQLALEF